MNGRKVNQALRPLIDANAQRAAQGSAGAAGAAIIIAVQVNRQQGGVSSGTGQSSTATLDDIVPTPQAPGGFAVSAYGTVTTSVAGDPVSITLQRDGTPVGPTQQLNTGSAANAAFAIGPFVDSAGAGSHAYSIKATNGTGGHTVELSSFSVLAQEVL
jgi:hypothetical protein